MLKQRLIADKYLYTMAEVTKLPEGRGRKESKVEDTTKRGQGSKKDEQGERRKTIQRKKTNQSMKEELKQGKNGG